MSRNFHAKPKKSVPARGAKSAQSLDTRLTKWQCEDQGELFTRPELSTANKERGK
jgi:hypothetical protein